MHNVFSSESPPPVLVEKERERKRRAEEKDPRKESGVESPAEGKSNGIIIVIALSLFSDDEVRRSLPPLLPLLLSLSTTRRSE